MFGRKVLYKKDSTYGPILVYRDREGVHLINSDNFCQSLYRPNKKPRGTVWDYYLVTPFFSASPEEFRKICVLGLGAGSVVKLFNNTFKIDKITGVEINKDVIEIAKKYFDLNDQNLEIICGSADEYVRGSKSLFDAILIDTFNADKVDPNCNTKEFFSNVVRLTNPGGVVLANRVPAENQKEENSIFLEIFPPLFESCYKLKVLNNDFYFGSTKVISKKEIVKRIEETANTNPQLKFLKKFNEKDLVKI